VQMRAEGVYDLIEMFDSTHCRFSIADSRLPDST
jgi:hypothetical protein